MNLAKFYSLYIVKNRKEQILEGPTIYSSKTRVITIYGYILITIRLLGLHQSFKTQQIPQWHNFANSFWWSTVTKAFRKSRKAPQAIFPTSRAFRKFSVILIKAWDVEYCCLNPNCQL